MPEARDDFIKTVPNMFELNVLTDPYTLYLNAIGSDTVTVSCDRWTNIRTSQSVYLYVNEIVAGIMQVPSLDGTALGKPPVFNVPVKKYFQAGTPRTIRLELVEGSPPGPNRTSSKTLSFDVKADSLSDKLTIDITEGAAGYTDQYPSLMPANVAVIQGPAGTELKARSVGVVRFQDVGGATTCNFSLDDKGVCPLVLIRIDSLHETGQSDTTQNMITLTLPDSTNVLKAETVTFGEYVPATGPAAQAFESVSCNTVGIADGNTICVVSIIMKDPASQAKLAVTLPPGLTLVEKTFGKPISTGSDALDPFVTAAKGVAEFGVTATQPGTYKIAVYPQSMTQAYWTTDIVYKPLSPKRIS